MCLCLCVVLLEGEIVFRSDQVVLPFTDRIPLSSAKGEHTDTHISWTNGFVMDPYIQSIETGVCRENDHLR